MKRFFGVGLFGLAATLLMGCPVYSDGGGNTYRSCDGQTCWACPSGAVPGQGQYQPYGQSCTPWQCSVSADCPGGYYCASSGTCASYGAEDGGVTTVTVDASVGPQSCAAPSACPPNTTCGADGYCDVGSCEITGCVSGYVCELENATLQCVQPVTVNVPDAGTTTVDAGAVACQSSSDCSTTGALCLDGQCVAPANQCFDSSQCPSGDECVAGACTPTCSGGASCPTGYSCTTLDAGAAVCTGNPAPCEANPGVCASGTVCSQNHCVAPCGAGGTCAVGSECIQGGCVPVELAAFVCENDGVQDSCATGSVCLHHQCYIACNPDGGAGDGDAGAEGGGAATGCPNDNDLNVCKLVSESGTGYYVCGSSSSFGSECNPTTGLACANPSAVCIDGYCH